MTTLMQFLQSPLALSLMHALGWTLLHFLWQGAIISAVLWCALLLLSGQTSRVRYVASCVALALLVVLPIGTFAHIAAVDLKDARTTWNTAGPIDAALLPQVSAVDVSAPWSARIAFALDRRMPWLLAAWLAGAIFFVVRLNCGLLVTRRLKLRGTHSPSADLARVFECLRLRLGIKRAVRLLHSIRVQVPTVVGWLRPVVLIPASCMSGLSIGQIEAIFCHELAHVRRHDYLVSVFQSIAEALLFYHPAVWWISRQLRRDRECCCDEIAVAHGGDVLAYARALSYLEERRSAFPEFVLGANGGVLTLRIKRLLGYKTDAPASQFAAFALLALMAAVAGAYVTTIARAAQPKPSPMPALIITPLHAIGLVQEQEPAAVATHDRPLQAQYKTWLEQDVAYIITPGERNAYLQLKNDTERDKFIEQFWSKRNPPGSAPDAARQEHYARIAYSNQHFAANMPGWRTDRGHWYIVLGKPESIDSHPGGEPATNTPPYEVWHYRASGGAGQQLDLSFVDADGDGNYRLTGPTQNAQGVPSVATPVSGSEADAPPRGPVHVSSGVVAGNVISRVNPIYPPDAKSAGIQGTVVLAAIISKEGSVAQLRVVSGPQELQQSALDAVKQWTYRPYLLNGQPTEVQTTITVNYSLESPSASQAQGSAQQYNGTTLRKIGNGVSPPVAIYQVEPQFSEEARKAKFMGMVLVNLIVDESGSPQNVHVLRGVGMGLDEKAVEAIKQYKFKPAMENGNPVPVSLNVEVNFQVFDKAPSPVRKIGGGVSTPIVIHSVPPEYSPEAKAAKTEGIVLVNLIVDQQGIPQNVHVVRGLGNGLDEKAVEAVSQYRFKPAMENGSPVRVELNVEVNFKFF